MAVNMKVQTPALQKAAKPVVRASFQSRRSLSVAAQASTSASAPEISRRQLLNATAVTVGTLALPQLPALAAKAPSGFSIAEDLNDGYRFLYPFGWQEIVVKGTDIVYKDVIEPLESVSVTITDSPRDTITEFGDVASVTETLAKTVLTAPGQDVKVLSSSERADERGRKYYEVEFTVGTPRYTRHQLAVVTVSNGKFFTLTTGAGERRWGKMKDKLTTTMHSFDVYK